jgi:hypothetical protein
MPKKHCNGCNQDRDIEDFNLKDKTKGIWHTICRFCMAEYSREHYKNNKQTYIDKTKKRNQRISEENRTKLFAYLFQHPCVDCSETDAYVLEFDHVKGKKSNNISRMVMDGFSWFTIEAEIAKCEVRCANCHRIKEGEKRGWWRNLFNL